MYYNMLLIRRFEERAAQLYGRGLIAGFCHLYIGQEAVIVGMQTAQEKNDAVITAYRDHGHMLAAGMDPKKVMAELTGRAAGYSKGKGGSMHMFSKKTKFYGGHGIVGAQVPLGTGLSFAQKYLIENNQYAMGTSIHRSSKKSEFEKRGEPWGIKGKKINGMDVLEVYKAGKKAREKILKGEGPQ